MQQLGRQIKTVRLKNAVAAGTSDITDAAIIDMLGFEGVLIEVLFGTITSTAVTSVKVEQGAASSLSDAADLLGSSVAVADTESDKIVQIDIYRPGERYLRPIVDRGTANAVVDGIIAHLYGPRTEPITKDATVSAQEFHATPAEGTA